MYESFKYHKGHPHEKIHEYVSTFFKNIWQHDEYEITHFPEDFRPVIKACGKRLNIPFNNIFNEIKQLSEADQKAFCQAFEDSNKIKDICTDTTQAKYIDEIPESIREEVKNLFVYLYENVLDKIKTFKDGYGKLEVTYKGLFENNGNIKTCPFCRLIDIKDQYDKYRDAYDHYLPKSLYPLSAVNFRNLVPMCNDCNSFHKNDNDILYADNARTIRRKVFYPFDGLLNEVDVKIDVSKEETGIPDKANWIVHVSSKNGKDDEVNSWNEIFNIEDRYTRKIKGKIDNWIKGLDEYIVKIQKKKLGLTLNQIVDIYLTDIESENSISQSFLRRPALKVLIEKSTLLESINETKTDTTRT